MLFVAAAHANTIRLRFCDQTIVHRLMWYIIIEKTEQLREIHIAGRDA